MGRDGIEPPRSVRMSRLQRGGPTNAQPTQISGLQANFNVSNQRLIAMVKVCGSCGLSKNVGDFHWKNKSKNLRSSMCKLCHKLYRNEHYHRNRSKRIEQAKNRRKKHADYLFKITFDILKNNSCVDCGEKDIIVLDFDHRDSKNFDISTLVHSACSEEKLLNELDKCDIRCANCHRRKTAKTQNYRRYRFVTASEGFEPSTTELETVMLPITPRG